MIVVADTSPIHYLVLIGFADVLFPLYDRVVVPDTVAQELQRHGAPEAVHKWITTPPEWCEVRPDPPRDPALSRFLDAGESAAIALAIAVSADRLLIDDWDGRVEAERRRLLVTGTLGVLAEAHQQRLLDFETALARLSQTTFYLSDELIVHIRRSLNRQ